MVVHLRYCRHRSRWVSLLALALFAEVSAGCGRFGYDLTESIAGTATGAGGAGTQAGGGAGTQAGGSAGAERESGIANDAQDGEAPDASNLGDAPGRVDAPEEAGSGGSGGGATDAPADAPPAPVAV